MNKLLIVLGVLLMSVGARVSLAVTPHEAMSLTAPVSSFSNGLSSNPLLLPTWIPIAKPEMNADRIAHATVYDPVGDKIYLIGGVVTLPIELYTYVYDPVTDTWDLTKASIPTARTWIAGALVKGKIYIIGGYSNSGGGLDVNEEYTISTNTWATRAPRPRAALAHEEVVWRDSLIYCLGGTTSGSTSLTNVDIYNPATNTWAVGTALPSGFEMGGAAIIGDTIYMVGGLTRPATIWTTVVRGIINPATPTTITWTQRAPLPVPNAVNAATALGGKVYELGGFENGSTVTNALREYDPATDSWTTLTPYVVTIARGHYLVARPNESALYVIAGDANGNWSQPNDYYYKNVPPYGVEAGKIVPGREVCGSVFPQCWPNPFTSFTIVPDHEGERFTLYDISGRKVGTYQGDRIGEGLSPGVYFLSKIPLAGKSEDKDAKPLRIVKLR